ncbi:carboxymuconolactone decarboxylase family protein [Streptomyces sp. NBC_00203]|uniref:carboxymuconolactone decarboxylase family protein n=1 Tax=Streptomyces sp. NBC_00203 TaxID=2975680 RepID=UPI00324CE751
MPSPFRYTTPPPPKSATGRTADVYAQLTDDFGIDRPSTFVVLSSAPELLTATWALMRESLIAGEGDRTGKELAALGVSEANRCPFCVDAHTMLLHATGDHALAETVARGMTPADAEHARLLAFLDDPGPGPDWARGTTVGPAYAALRIAATTGAGLLDEADRILVRETLQGWDGAHPTLAWDGLPDRSRPGARLALLAALAPYRITDEDVTAWREPVHTDHCLVHLVAYGAFAAVDRIESALPVHTLNN